MRKDFRTYSDDELCRLVADGGTTGRKAFEELYARLSPRVFKYCLRVLGDRELAADVFQETFVRFYKSVSRQRPMWNTIGFIIKIARNLCLSARSSKHFGTMPLEDLHLAPSVTNYEKQELLDIVQSAVETLPIDFREVLVLREYDGIPYPEIAEMLNLPLTTVKIRVFRAKDKIRKILAPYINDLQRQSRGRQERAEHQ